MPRRGKAGTPLEVLRVFLKLGLTSFGGPVSHLGYFHREFVVRRAWLDERAYADLVALCQFLPGPASSQTGFAVGLIRAGPLGGLAAWVGFTLPSALAMILFAYGESALEGRVGDGLLHGLKLVAVAIVAQAVMGMAESLCPDRPRAAIAVLSLIIMGFAPAAWAQIAVITLGAIAGLMVCRNGAAFAARDAEAPMTRRMGIVVLGVFSGLLALSFAQTGSDAAALAAAFYRSGALVFGGGHVVLPLLRASVVDPGWVSDSAFLAGYGAAQAMPGPLFAFAAYLGAVAGAPGGVPGAFLALAAIFAPGLLLVMAALPFWQALSARPDARAAMAGVNAAVVGLLASALYIPIWTSAVKGPADFAIAAAGFVALIVWRAPPSLIVVLTAAAEVALRFAG